MPSPQKVVTSKENLPEWHGMTTFHFLGGWWNIMIYPDSSPAPKNPKAAQTTHLGSLGRPSRAMHMDGRHGNAVLFLLLVARGLWWLDLQDVSFPAGQRETSIRLKTRWSLKSYQLTFCMLVDRNILCNIDVNFQFIMYWNYRGLCFLKVGGCGFFRGPLARGT